MMLLRSVQKEDLPHILALAHKAGVGITTLPKNEQKLKERIALSLDSFAKEVTAPQSENYLFVLEDPKSNHVVGISAIEAAVGHDLPFYSYKLSKKTRICHELDIRVDYDVFNLVNDYQDCTEICTLFLDKAYRKNSNGLLLSRARFLYMAQFQQRFANLVIAEMRGVSDEEGNSPFWDNLGRHFFKLPFAKADKLSAITNKQFIADLMPRFPIYVQLLDTQAQNVIAKSHESTKPALKILELEGFRYTGYIDIFDAGPTIEAPLDKIKTIELSQLFQVSNIIDEVNTKDYLIANTAKEFRATLAHVMLNEAKHQCIITKDCAKILKVKKGDKLRITPLKYNQSIL
jgi:arginine N-succinyltransferase